MLFFVGGGALNAVDGTSLRVQHTLAYEGGVGDVFLILDDTTLDCFVFLNRVGILNEALTLNTPVAQPALSVNLVERVFVSFDESSGYFSVQRLDDSSVVCMGDNKFPLSSSNMSTFTQYGDHPNVFFSTPSGLVSLHVDDCSNYYWIRDGLDSAGILQYYSILVLAGRSDIAHHYVELRSANDFSLLSQVVPTRTSYTSGFSNCRVSFAIHGLSLFVASCMYNTERGSDDPFLFSFLLNGSGSWTLGWVTPLASYLPEFLAGASPLLLAVDKAGNLIGSGASHGDQTIFGGMYSFDTKDGTMLQNTCVKQDVCGVYGQPSIGKDGALYTFVMSDGEWEGLISFVSVLPGQQGSFSSLSIILVCFAAGIVLLAVGHFVYRCFVKGLWSSGGQYQAFLSESDSDIDRVVNTAAHPSMDSKSYFEGPSKKEGLKSANVSGGGKLSFKKKLVPV